MCKQEESLLGRRRRKRQVIAFFRSFCLNLLLASLAARRERENSQRGETIGHWPQNRKKKEASFFPSFFLGVAALKWCGKMAGPEEKEGEPAYMVFLPAGISGEASRQPSQAHSPYDG